MTPARSNLRGPWSVKLPTSWSSTQLRRVVRFRNGADYKDVEVPTGGYPVYGSGGEFRRASSYLYEGPSVLFGRKGTVDRPLLVDGCFWTVDTMFFTEIGPPLDPRYLHYYATIMPFGYYATNTTVPSMTQNDLGGHVIPLPAVEEQRAIADFLDRETARIDTLIAKQEQLITTLRERRSALISHSVARRGVERVPLRRVAEVIDCAHVTADFVDDDVAYPVASIRECQGSVVDLSACKYTTEEFYVLLRAGGRTPRIGDLLFVRNVSVGLVSTVAQDTGEFAVGQETVLLRRSALVDPDFLRYSLMGNEVRHEIEARMIGSTFRRINVSAIRALPVPLPTIEDQHRIAADLDELTARIDGLIEKTERFIELSKERRSALITAAVTGQLDVRGEVA